MPTPLRVAVLNDYEIVVAGLATLLGRFPDRIGVVELDSRMPVVSDVDLVLYDTFGQPQGADLDLAPRVGDSRVVVFSWNTEPGLVQASLDAGAAGYVSKAVTAEALVEALERVAAGETVVPRVGAPEDDRFGRRPGADLDLSPREAEVLALICQGLSNQDITERAFIGMNTVKTYIRSLYRKIGVESRTQALLWGIDHGFRPDRSRVVDPDA